MKTFNSKEHRYPTAINMFLIALAIAALMAGMTGCAGRPPASAIEIRTWYHLAAVSNNMSADYVLENDLDPSTEGYEELAGPTANNGSGWKPIRGVNESQPEYFTGVFDGQGHKIKDLFINRPDEGRVGLFHYINVLGVIRNVELVNATVTGGERVGSLVGQVASAFVSDCNATGTVTGNSTVGGLAGGIWTNGIVSNCHAAGSVSGNDSVGGLVGYINEGTVTGSYSTGVVTGDGSVGGFGGLVGVIFEGTVTGSYSTGSVTGGDGTGGLVGVSHGSISDSYASGNVTGNEWVGGLVGQNSDIVSNCYATGNVTGDTQVGGLMGRNDEALVSNSYAAGSVTGDTSFGGLVGVNTGTVTNSFWDIETSGTFFSDGGTGKNTTEMQDIVTFLDAAWSIIAVGSSSQRNPANIWNIVDLVTYPFLSWQQV